MLNNNKHPAKNNLWYYIHGIKHQMIYGIADHKHDHRLISESDSKNRMLKIFQSDCDVINHHLNDIYNFDIIENTYKLYRLNLFRNFGQVDKDQPIHTDYKYDPKNSKLKILLIKPNKQQQKRMKRK